MRRRVAVTGLGAVTPLGIDLPSSWKALVEGKSGIKSCVLDGPDLPCKVAGTVNRALLEERYASVLTNNRAQSPPFIGMAMVAADEALVDSGVKELLADSRLDPTRVGVAIGSGIGSCVEEIVNANDTLCKGGLRKLSPYFVPRLLNNMAAGNISIKYSLQGPNHSAVTACASGAHSIGDAMRFIMYNDCDVMVSGGTESSVNALSMAGFSRLRALSTKFNDEPEFASRPFDRDRDGFVMSEGAGVVVLEEMEHAKKRGAKIYAELVGYGLSADAFHLTAPSEDGRGALSCMRSTLNSASVSPDSLDYINAHATSTPLGDAVELEAISSLTNSTVHVSSTKGSVGHLLGAAGAIEAIFTIMALRENTVPGTLNLCETEIDKNESVVLPTSSTPLQINYALSNSFGFGGTNAGLLFRKV